MNTLQNNLFHLLTNVLDEISKIIEFSYAVLYVFNERENKLNLLAEKGLSKQRTEMVSQLGFSLSEWVFNNKKSILINNTSVDTTFPEIQDYPSSSMLYVPLTSLDDCIGVIGLESDKINNFSKKHIAILTSFTKVALNAINDIQFHQELEQQAKQLAILNEVGQILSSTLKLEDLFGKIYEQVGRVMDIDAFFIALYIKGDNILDFVLLMDEGKKFKRKKEVLGDNIASQSIKKKQAILINRTAEEYKRLQTKKQSIAFGNISNLSRSLIATPIILRGEVIGAISTQSYHFNAYNKHHLSLLQTIANQSAIAIENARLYELLKIEKNKLETILNNLDEGVAIVDSNYQIKYLNKWFNDRYGTNIADPICYKTFADLNIPCDLCLLKKPKKEKIQKIEIRGKANKSYLLSQIPIKTPNGELNILIVISDITKKKKLDEEIIKTEKLKAVINLVGAIAHQLNQPLTGITCYSSLILDELHEGDKFYDEIREIETQALRLNDLIVKFQKITRFEKKGYLDNQEILDIDKSISE